jgi:hypothetical protein
MQVCQEYQPISHKVYLKIAQIWQGAFQNAFPECQLIKIKNFSIKVLFILSFKIDPPAKNSSETGCRSHKVYLNSWVTEISGCESVQININSSVFGMDCPSPKKEY